MSVNRYRELCVYDAHQPTDVRAINIYRTSWARHLTIIDKHVQLVLVSAFVVLFINIYNRLDAGRTAWQ